MYTQNPLKATSFQPAKNATILGPKSLAGLNPAWVRGAITAMSAPTVRPMIGGTKPVFIVSFFWFVKAKITKDRIPVPKASARNAIETVIGFLKEQKEHDHIKH